MREEGGKKHQLKDRGRAEGEGEVCAVNRQENKKERSGFISRHDPDNQKEMGGGAAQRERG